MEKFRIGLSSDFRRPDGSPAFPSFDLRPLDDPRIDWAYVPVTDGVIRAADMTGFDVLILLAGQFSADSLPGDGRLAAVARFGVGYDFWNRDDRRSQLVSARFYIPWTDQGAIGLEAAREIQGTLDRPAAWYFTLAWRLNSSRYRAGHEVPPEIISGTAPP